MGVKLKLHEAIAVVLINKIGRTASFEEIADEINRRGLYIRKDGLLVPDYQIMQRSKLSNGQYHHLFEQVSCSQIKLKNV
jgi:hypothetical protein